MVDGEGNDLLAMDSSSRRLDGEAADAGFERPTKVCCNAQMDYIDRNTNLNGNGNLNHPLSDAENASSSSFLSSDVCMGNVGVGMSPTAHENCSSPKRMEGVCCNDSVKQPSCSLNPDALKKTGVVSLPSLKDLGDPPTHNDAVQLDDNDAVQLDDDDVQGYMSRFQ